MDVSKSLEQTSSLMFFVFLVFFLGGAGPGGKRRGSSILIEYIIGIHVWFEPGSDNSIMILRTGILHMSTGLGCFAPMIAARGSGRSV